MATEIKSTSIKSQNIIAEPQTNKPGSPEAGQIIQATGTGDIAKGIYHYSGAAWMSLDNAQGDLETLRLIMSTDTSAVGFSSALNSTSTLAGNTNAVPHETSTGTGLLGALEIPSTGGDALLTEFDANKVFRYFSAGANNNNDYFGIPIDIPAQTRGENIVIKFKYRTEEASDTTSNGDFQVSVWDKTNGVSTTQASTLTTGTTISAGSNILMTAKTNLAVGDKIWFETGGTGSTVGNVANSLTQAYITEISSTDNNIKVSEDVQVIASGIAVTGWLSDKTSGLLPAADSDTNKVGKDFSIAVKTEETTAQIVLWISNKSVTTNVIELFFDGILVSQNKFLQASSQTKVGNYWIGQLTSAMSTLSTTMEFNLSTADIKTLGDTNTLDNYLSVTNVSSVTRFTALQDCIFDMNGTIPAGTGADDSAAIIHDDGTGTQYLIAYGGQTEHNSHMAAVAGQIAMKKGEFVFLKLVASNGNFSPAGRTAYSGSTPCIFNVAVTPQTSPVVILESQDEIFTDWQDGGTMTVTQTTTTGSKPSTIETDQVYWRRDGSDMLLKWTFYASDKSGGTSGTGDYLFHLPTGYHMDAGRVKYYTTNEGYGDFTTQSSTMLGYGQIQDNSGGAHIRVNLYAYDSNKFRAAGLVTTHSTVTRHSFVGSDNGYTWANMNVWTFEARIPIQGFNAKFNPLLSMPLVDFGSFTNTYSARIDNNGTATITSQSENFISSVSRTGTGVVAIVWNSGFFTQPPVVTATVETSGEIISQSVTATTSGVTLEVINHASASNDRDFCIIVQRQGSDFREPPAPFAAVIKPAVAYVKDLKAVNTAGGTASSTGSFEDRELNTIQGESWFIDSLSSNVVTLQAGTYKIKGRAPFFDTGNTTIRLFDNTNSSVLAEGESTYVDTSNNHFNVAEVQGVFSFTVATAVKLQYRCSSTVSSNGLGVGMNLGQRELYASLQIEKLK